MALPLKSTGSILLILLNCPELAAMRSMRAEYFPPWTVLESVKIVSVGLPAQPWGMLPDGVPSKPSAVARPGRTSRWEVCAAIAATDRIASVSSRCMALSISARVGIRIRLLSSCDSMSELFKPVQGGMIERDSHYTLPRSFRAGTVDGNADGVIHGSALVSAAELGIADALRDGPLPVDEIAKRTGTEAGNLFRLLRALDTIGVFRQTTPGVFENTSTSSYLRQDVAGSLWPMVRLWGDRKSTRLNSSHIPL